MVIPRGLGCADWVWNDDTQTHDPCCSRILEEEGFPCHSGPLKPEQIEAGDCGEDHSQPYMFSKGLTPQQRASMYRLVEEMKAHPWHSAILPRRRNKRAEAIVLGKELFYSRILRIRWSQNPLRSTSARIWFGGLEIVVDPIPKRSWTQRTNRKRKR